MPRCRSFASILIFLALLLVAGCGEVVAPKSSPTPPAAPTVTSIIATPLPATPPPTATSAPSWRTVQRFTGIGEDHTPVFSVPGTWRIVYTCTDGELAIEVFNTQGTIIDPVAAQAVCPVTNTTAEYDLGTSVSLDITGNGKITWVVQVQEFM